MLITNAIIYTLSSPEICRQMRVIDGRVSALGTENMPLFPLPNEEVIDLQGKWVMPSFHDAHLHLFHLGRKRRILNLSKVSSITELKEKTLNFLQTNVDAHWVIATGLNLRAFQESPYLTLAQLDELSSQKPLSLYTFDGHCVMGNTLALKRAGIIQKFSEGYLLDDDMPYLTSHHPKELENTNEADILYAQDLLLKAGITEIDEASTKVYQFKLLKKMEKEGKLKIKCNLWLEGMEEFEKYRSQFRQVYKSDLLQVRSVKLFADGALGSKGAFVSFAYEPNNNGLELLSKKQLIGDFKTIIKYGFQPVIHAIGDRAINNICEALTYLSKQTIAKQSGLEAIRQTRLRIEHNQLVSAHDLAIYKELRLIGGVQPCHYTSDRRWLYQTYPLLKESTLYQYPWKSLLNNTSCLPIGTDAPVESLNVFSNLQSAENARLDWEQTSEPLTRLEAIQGYTLHPAYANFKENTNGVLNVNYQADFVVFNNDILKVACEKLSEMTVDSLFVNGMKTL